MKKSVNKKKVEPSEEGISSQVLERVKVVLKKRDMTLAELAEKLDITTNGLYLSFKREKVTLLLLQRIGKVLNVNPLYFFEYNIVERLVDEITKRPNNPDLKGFFIGFSRDVAKGMPIEDAAWKNLDTDSYNNKLLM